MERGRQDRCMARKRELSAPLYTSRWAERSPKQASPLIDGLHVCPSKFQRRVVDDFLHHEEGPGLAHARQRDQLLAVDTVEILHVADSDLEEIVEVAGDEVTVEHELQPGDRLLEDRKAFRRRAVEHDA